MPLARLTKLFLLFKKNEAVSVVEESDKIFEEQIHCLKQILLNKMAECMQNMIQRIEDIMKDP